MEKPRTWSEYAELAKDELRLQQLMRIRLIELVFSQDNATSIRAAELLQQMGSDYVVDDYSDISSEELIRLDARADDWIKSNANGNDSEAD